MVFVVDKNRVPLDPCHEARARYLLKQGKAAVIRRYPFTIILKDVVAEDCTTHGHRVKLDPGSKVTGIAVLQEGTNRVVWAAELHHRGQQIRDALLKRSQVRRSRRNRKTRYRPARFLNRKKPQGWLAPSLMSRVYNTVTWVKRIMKWCPVTAISMELVKFDTQKMQNPEISGIEYQQGELQGYEVREYLLEKWGRKCAYCGKTGVPLEVEHIVPRSRGGSDRVSNLTLACHDCNQKKGSKTAAEFGHPRIQAKAKIPLKDASAANTVRWKLSHLLQNIGLPVECGSGGLTKYNRARLGIPKCHWMDAVCVGVSIPDRIETRTVRSVWICARGYGNRRMCGTNKHGFPIKHRLRQKVHYGFMTGDVVIAVAPSGKYAGTYIGRVTVRKSGGFGIVGASERVPWVNHKHCKLLHKLDGYCYA